MQFDLMASMMCADYGNLEKEVKSLEEGGIDSFHIDVMDGRYVPNFAMSLNDMCYIAGAAKRPLDVHLMIEHPNNRIQLFLLSMKEDMDFEIYWDGACSADKIIEYAPKGVAGFVLGTTLLFGKDKPYGETLEDIRKLRF